MSDRQRNPGSHIIDRRMMKIIFAAGTLLFIFFAGFWQLLWHSDIHHFSDLFSLDELKEYFIGFFDMSKGKSHMSPTESSVFFSTFVMAQFWNIFNVRYYKTDRSLLSDLVDSITGKKSFWDCFSQGFILILAVVLMGQIMIVNLAGNFFEVAPLSAADWAWIILCTSPILLIPGIFRLFRNHRRNGHA